MSTVPTWKVVVAAGILVAVLIGFYAYQAIQRADTVNENRYNGFDFYPAQGGIWQTRIEVGGQPYDLPLHHHPRETEDVIVHAGVTDPLLRGDPQRLYISIDPDAGSQVVVAGVEIARVTGSRYNLLNIPTQSALSRPAETAVDIPIVHCDDATNETAVIQFAHDPETNAIVRDGNCVILFYQTPEDAVRVADRYVFELLGIM